MNPFAPSTAEYAAWEHTAYDATTAATELLDDVHAFLGRHVAFPSGHALIAVTLWAVHTHLIERFESTPRLAVLSPEKQSGKSRTLDILELLCPGAEKLTDASAAYLFRRIAAGDVTVLLDECDATWKRRNSDESAEALRSIVNAGHRRGATVGRVEMNGKSAELRRFPVYAPVALAGIGSLPDTILDRAVIVRMRRRAPGETVAEFRERTTPPEGRALRERIADWCATVADRIGDPWPTMPKGVTDRPADVWEPLIMVAELAGGHWPESARKACTAFVIDCRDDTASLGVKLLSDLRNVFGDTEAMWTEDLLGKLHAREESPWGDWYGRLFNARDLAKLLSGYRTADDKPIKPRDVRIGEINRKGYRREDLWDAWQRYLPHPSATRATSATALARPVALVALVADTSSKPGEAEDEANLGRCAICQARTVRYGQRGHPLCSDCRAMTRPRRNALAGVTK